MIQVACGGCGKVYRVPDEHAGKRTRCKQCSAVIAIPAPVILTNPAPVPAEEAVIEPAPASAAPESEPPPAAPAARAGAPARRPMKMPPKKVLGGPKKPGGAPRPPFARKPLQGRQPGRPAPGRPVTARKKPADEGLEGAEGETAGAGSKKKKVILIAGIGVAAAAAIGVAAFLLLGGSGEDDGNAVASKAKGGAEAALAGGKEKKEGTEAKVEEKVAATPEPAAVALPITPLSIIPKDVGFVAKLDAGVMLSFPGAREGIEKKLEEAAEVKAILEEAGFDPLSHLRTIWIAGDLEKLIAARQVPPPGDSPPGEPAAAKAAAGTPDVDPSAVVLVEGVFDKEKFIGALTKARKITAKPKIVGKHEVHDFTDGEGYLSLLSAEHLLLGAGKAFNDALRLTEGGPSVRENALLADLSGDFSSNPIAWAAVALPASLAGQAEAQLQAKVEGVFVSVERSADGSGAAIEALLRCPSAEEVKKLQGAVGGLLAGLPPPVKLFLIGLKTQAEDRHFRISLDLPEQILQPLLSGSGAAGAPPADGEEAEETGVEESAGEAGAEPAEEGKAEAEAAEDGKAEPEETPEAAPEEPSAEPKEEAKEPAGEDK